MSKVDKKISPVLVSFAFTLGGGAVCMLATVARILAAYALHEGIIPEAVMTEAQICTTIVMVVSGITGVGGLIAIAVIVGD